MGAIRDLDFLPMAVTRRSHSGHEHYLGTVRRADAPPRRPVESGTGGGPSLSGFTSPPGVSDPGYS